MSDDPRDELRDDPHDELHDDELSRRYRALPTELPHPDTDAAIRAAARQTLTGAKRKPRSAVFYGGLAMAASVTLVMAVLLPSWRSGQLHEEVAVRVPAETSVAPETKNEAVAPATRPAPAEATIAASERALSKAGTPAPGITSIEPAPERAGPAGAAPMMVESRLAETDTLQEAVSADAPASAERREMADHARAQTVFRQKARMAMAPPATPVPEKAMADDALLLAGRYAEALAALQTGAVATDPALDSRRDLLRQLLPDEAKALQCQAGTGPDSARALCHLLQQYQAVQQGRAERSGLAAGQAALQQALQAEGHNPAPLLHAIADLPATP